MWALGCLFSELVTGKPLMPGKDTIDQLCLVMQLVGPLPQEQLQCLAADQSLAGFKVPKTSELSALDTSK